MDKHDTVYLQLLVKWLQGPEKAGLRRSYLEWLRRRLPQWFPGETFPEMHDLQEAYEMITNRFGEWKERQRLVGVQQGMQQGVEQGIERGIERGRLEGASQADLEHLADRVLDATSLDDLFSK